MKRYRIGYSPSSLTHLKSIFDYIASHGSEHVADRYVDGIVDACESLGIFPRRGTPRPDIGEDIRSISHRRRVTIYFRVNESDVEIGGIAYGGRNLSLSNLF